MEKTINHVKKTFEKKAPEIEEKLIRLQNNLDAKSYTLEEITAQIERDVNNDIITKSRAELIEKQLRKELEEIGVAETYVISGTEVKYTCEAELIKKPIEITFTLEDLGDNKYKFKYGDSFDFATVEVKGNTLSYEVGEEEPTKMIFKRQK